MNKRSATLGFLTITAVAILLLPFAFPQLDLIVAGLFYKPDIGFFYANTWPIKVLHEIAGPGSRWLAIFLAICATAGFAVRRPVLWLKARSWLFLFLALLLGAGLIANVGFKDNWGRARPRDVVEFGGTAAFTPAFMPADECAKNCSFVSGDAAYGFILVSLALVMPSRLRRRTFWIMLGVGSSFGIARIISGAHFLSDVIGAGISMFTVMFALYALMFGRNSLREALADI